jgi:5-phospho-D-xylono-1,4-lactonase
VCTVEGDISPASLGPTDSHNHFFFVSPLQPGDEMPDVECAVFEARTLSQAGVRTVVDWTPLGLGRSPQGLVQVAQASGLQVVGATGVHRHDHYGPEDPLRAEPVEALARRFVADLTAPVAPSGVIKTGASYHRLQPLETRAFAAAAQAHHETGVPICIHTGHGTMGAGIVEHLSALGVAPTAVVLAHLDRNPDAGEHAETAATGVWLQLDGPGRTKYWPDSTVLQLLADLAGRGFSAQSLPQRPGKRSPACRRARSGA